jgi:hypothetical protein
MQKKRKKEERKENSAFFQTGDLVLDGGTLLIYHGGVSGLCRCKNPVPCQYRGVIQLSRIILFIGYVTREYF